MSISSDRDANPVATSEATDGRPRDGGPRARRSGKRIRKRYAPATGRGLWMLLAPGLIVSIVIIILPICYTIWLALSHRSVTGVNSGFVGLSNFQRMFASADFWHSLRVTFLIFCVCITVETVLGVALGYLLSLDVRGRRVFQGVMLIPTMTAQVAVGLMWLLIFDPTLGAANQILRHVGIQPTWLADPDIAPWALMIVDIWHATPLVALIVGAGIRNLPSDVFESAMVDGARPWQKALHIGLPLLKPVILTAMMIRAVDLIKFFDIPYILTQGGPLNATNTLNIYSYREAFQNQNASYAATLQITLLVVVMLICAVFVWLQRRAIHD